MARMMFLRPFKLVKPYLPESLYGRVLLILVAPLVLATVITTYIFLDHHLDSITRRLADDIASEVSSIVKLDQLKALYPEELEVFSWESYNLELHYLYIYTPREVLQTPMRVIGKWFLEQSLSAHLDYPYKVTIDKDTIFINILLPDKVLHFEMSRKRLLSKTTPIYLMWVLGLPILLFIIAAFFMKNQVRPIRKLAKSADKFGKGLAGPAIKPEGAAEVRQAMIAFNRMRERIQRQITQRTDMLAGVSHDLRTPLTRMGLQLAMLEDSPEAAGLKADVEEMRNMVESYLAFARGEKPEKAVMTNIYDLIETVAEPYRDKIELPMRVSLRRQVKPQSLKRCFQNLFANADRYATKIRVTLEDYNDGFRIEINDNGPGIPKGRRQDVFKPFYRLDAARNLDHGGVGLGLSIAQDAIHQHGGTIELDDSLLGGVKVIITLPG